MSKQANPTLIGAFVVGGIALLVIATVLFGGSSLFVKNNRFVTYFEGSVQGLRIGSNVTFRGVRVGYVTDVRLQAQIDSMRTLVPVTIEIVPGAFQIVDGDRVLDQEDLVDRLRVQDLIDAGLRAQLNMESFVTGQLLIEMDFLPDLPAVMRGHNPPYPEIPTIPNDIEQALGNVERLISVFKEKVDIDRVLEDIQGLLHGLNTVVNSPDLQGGLSGINQLVNAPATRQLAASIDAAARELDATLAATRALVDNASGKLDPAAVQFDATLKQLREALHTLTTRIDGTLGRFDHALGVVENSVQRIDSALGDDAVITRQLTATLTELERSARTLRQFLDYVERHPDAFLRGK